MSYSNIEDVSYISKGMASDFSGAAINVRDVDSGSVQFTWSGYNGSNGAVHLQASLDKTNWHDLGGAQGAFGVNELSDSVMWEITAVNYNFLRLRFFSGDGTAGTATASYVFKSRK